jgi:hypothetical protein
MGYGEIPDITGYRIYGVMGYEVLRTMYHERYHVWWHASCGVTYGVAHGVWVVVHGIM